MKIFKDNTAIYIEIVNHFFCAQRMNVELRYIVFHMYYLCFQEINIDKYLLLWHFHHFLPFICKMLWKTRERLLHLWHRSPERIIKSQQLHWRVDFRWHFCSCIFLINILLGNMNMEALGHMKILKKFSNIPAKYCD